MTEKGPYRTPDGRTFPRPEVVTEPKPLLDEDGWPILENASEDDLRLAIKAVGALGRYGNFIRAALAGMYVERRRTP